jgi:hypothetical protein
MATAGLDQLFTAQRHAIEAGRAKR